MSGSIVYLDTSAFVKMVVVERESTALRGWLARWSQTRLVRRDPH